MSLDVTLIEIRPTEVYSRNITHNLVEMAEAAGIYKYCWRPQEMGICMAHELIQPLSDGLKRLIADPAKFKAFDSPNGWGTYEHLYEFVEAYLEACIENPGAMVSVSR